MVVSDAWRYACTVLLAYAGTGCLVPNPRHDDDDGRGTAAATAGDGVATGSPATSANTTGTNDGTEPPAEGPGEGPDVTTGIDDSADAEVGEDGDTATTGRTPGSCDAFEIDNCGDGAACKPFKVENTWFTDCFELDGQPGARWAPCDFDESSPGSDSCGSALVCSPPGFLPVDRCVPLCQGTPDNPVCLEPGTECSLFGGDVFGMCLPMCDPLAQTGCSEGQACFLETDEDGQYTPVCGPPQPPGNGAYLDPCEGPKQCMQGLACIDAAQVLACSANRCCVPICSLSMPDLACEAGGGCEPAWPPEVTPPAFDDVGLCLG